MEEIGNFAANVFELKFSTELIRHHTISKSITPLSMLREREREREIAPKRNLERLIVYYKTWNLMGMTKMRRNLLNQTIPCRICTAHRNKFMELHTKCLIEPFYLFLVIFWIRGYLKSNPFRVTFLIWAFICLLIPLPSPFISIIHQDQSLGYYHESS